MSQDGPDRSPCGVAFSLRPVGVVHAAGSGQAGHGSAVLELFPPWMMETGHLQAGSRIWVLTYRSSRGCTTGPSGKRIEETCHPLGICQALVVEVRGALLRVEGLDLVDGTPILQIQSAPGRPGRPGRRTKPHAHVPPAQGEPR